MYRHQLSFSLHTHRINQQKHVHQYVKSNIVILHQHVSITIVTIIRGFVTRIQSIYRLTQKNGNFWKTQQKLKESKQKKCIDRNWTITTCLLKDSNPNDQCLKITSCRWRRPPRMHSFTATTHFKSSRFFVSPYMCNGLTSKYCSELLAVYAVSSQKNCAVSC